MSTFWLIVFTISVFWMVYTYVGYPCVLLLKKWWRQRNADTVAPAHISDDMLPDVAVIIVARNAAHQIAPKIRSCLDSNYPSDRIRVLLAIDGPDEATASAAESLADPRVTILRNAQHRGKAACVNDAVALCTQSILVMCDARQRIDGNAIRYLVESLLNSPERTAISGELQFEVPEGNFVGLGLDAYWRYEKWLRRTESEVSSTIGMTGALYAMRRSAFRPIPSETILDDVLIPMQMILDGHRTGFDSRAIAFDLPSVSMQQERRRKIRTLAGNFQLLQLCPALLNPFRNRAFFGFFSHKVCRLLTPVALLCILLSSIALASSSLFFALSLAACLTVICCSLLAHVFPSTHRWLPIRLSNTCIEMHMFVVLGFIGFLRDRNLYRWGADIGPQGDKPEENALRVLYLVSLFPCWSETFIVREIRALQARGVDIRIASLKAASEPMVQPDAQALLDKVIYPRRGLASVFSPLMQVVFHPVQSLYELLPLFTSLWSRPAELAKSIITWWRTLGMIARVRQFAPDHVHAHWATYPSTAARILADRIGTHWSFTGHAHDIFVHDHDLSAKLCQASFAVTISDYNRRKLSARMPLALRNQLHVIHCGIFADDIPFHTGNRKAGQIVAVGRLDPIKGFIHLIEACRLLNERGVDFQCDIIGDGPLRATLQRAIENARLNDRVRLTGALPQHEVRQRINEAAIFVLPSVQLADGNADGIPVALMEAMASGAAVISTRVSGIPELVENGITGMLVSPGNAAALAEAIANLLPNEILRARLAGMAHQYILQAFDANLEADKLLKLIRANLPESRTPAESKPLPTPVGLQPEPAPPPLPNPLRIMIMTDEMEVGGSQRQIVQLASGLKARRIECTVVYFINPSFLLDELHAAGVETIRVDKRKPVDPVFLRQLRKTIRQWRPDVLHCFSFTAELWGAVALQTLPARQRPALISSVRGTYEWYSERQWKLKRWVSLRSQAIISNSLEGADYAARRMQLPLADFSIVANGVRVLQPQAELVHQLRSKYLLSPVASGSDDMTQDDRGMLLLFVGRLVEHKNLPRLLDAFAPVAAEYPHVSLLLVGSGPLGPSLKAQVQQHNLSHQVRMLGERDDVAALMSAADIVVAPSLREGLSNVILEAMALGRPVIATPVGATPDVIDDGVNGLLVDASDTQALSAAMRRLIGDADLRKRLGTAAHARVTEKYSPQVMVRSMLKEYQRVSQR